MSSRVFIEPLPPLDELLRTATAADLQATASLSAASRRREALAWRGIVRNAIADADIGYDEWGAPVVENSPLHIGVSHSRNSVAVIISDVNCAIDIESRTRNFERVRSRYLSPQEAALSRHPDFLAVAWCAKECLYKYHRRGNADFLRDVRITSVDFVRNRIGGTLFGGDELIMTFDISASEVVVCIG
ncbi:MAG: 4'-phosphopantetheinyl transferase family protein [Alistipes sp.]